MFSGNRTYFLTLKMLQIVAASKTNKSKKIPVSSPYKRPPLQNQSLRWNNQVSSIALKAINVNFGSEAKSIALISWYLSPQFLHLQSIFHPPKI